MSSYVRVLAAFVLVLIVSCVVEGEEGEPQGSVVTQTAQGIFVFCVHFFPSRLECPNIPGLTPETDFVPMEDVDSIRIGFFVNDTLRASTFPVNLEDTSVNIDAVFFTRDVINKFAIPWYVSEKVPLDTLEAILDRIPKDQVGTQGQ